MVIKGSWFCRIIYHVCISSILFKARIANWNASKAMLREATPNDISEIQRVRASVRENRLISRTISDSEVLTSITESGKGWVIESSECIVAFGIADNAARSIWALFVEPDQEGKGYGRRLHDAMVQWLFEQSATPIWLSTDPNTRAQSFYEAAGWQNKGSMQSGEIRFERAEP